MAPIILILILAFVALSNGDPSGVEAIAKIIGGIVLFIVVGSIAVFIMDNPEFIIILIIIVSLIVAVYNLIKENNSKSINNTYQEQKTDNNIIVNNYKNDTPSLSDFQKELQQNTKTPQQVADENWLKEKEQIINEVNNDYKCIKQKLLDKAKQGQYSVVNGHKHISQNYTCPYLLRCVSRQYYHNPSGRMGTSSYRTNDKVYYHINKIEQYNLYLSIIRDLASKDNINISPFFVEVDVALQKENRINLPYTYKHEWKASSHKINVYLKCSIEY